MNSVTPVNDEVRRNFYGRFKGHGITKAQKELLKTELNDISLKSVSVEDNPNRVPLDIESYFDNKPVWLEVGFGSGEHLIYQATCNPDVSFIGCEPYINGVVSFLGKVKRQKIKNIFLYAGLILIFILAIPTLFLPSKFTIFFGRVSAKYLVLILKIILNTKVTFHGVENLKKVDNFFLTSG